MKRRFYIFSVIIFLIPNVIKALECDASDKDRLSKLANNITYIIEDYEDNGNTYFKVTFSGVSKEIRIYNPANWLYYRNLTDNEFGETMILGLNLDTTYTFYIISATDSCLVYDFRTLIINIPSINIYYSDDLCKDISEYKLCQKWTSNNGISYEEFASRVTEYKNSKKSIENNNIINQNKNNKYFDFMDIYNKYYLPTFICMICLLLILIILWIRENKKNKL